MIWSLRNLSNLIHFKVLPNPLGPTIYTGSNTSFCHNVIVREVQLKGGHRTI
jgi:hypothetical protein